MENANKVARSVHDQAAKGDPHALRLTTMPYAGNLFVIYADNCTPVSGHTRHYGDDGDVDSGGMMPLLRMLAPEVL